ncbi:hypothetical protein BANRA_03068 [Escherichia coli]|nr:hypothetical protein BANRA_03068 [Escherichia coli]
MSWRRFSLQIESRVFGGKLFPPYYVAHSHCTKFILHKNNNRFYYAIDYLFPENK